MDILIPLLILIAVVITIVMLPVAILRIYQRKAQQEQEQIRVVKASSEHAIWTNATVISIRSQNPSDSARTVTRVDLRLEVEAPGGEKYQATTTWLVDVTILPRLLPGETVIVKIDDRNPKIIYPNMHGAEYFYWN